MRKHLILTLGLMSAGIFGQYNILGSEIIKVGETQKFSADLAGKCEDCYIWKISPEEIISVESNNEGQITLKGSHLGTAKISLTIETENESFVCEKNISIQNATDQKEKQCDVEITNFKDVKVDDDTMSFFPNKISQKYSYLWKATYADGTRKESEEKIPQFINNPNTIITSVVVHIINKSSLCSSIITRTYGEKYWFQKIDKVEQRKYIQESYLKIKDQK